MMEDATRDNRNWFQKLFVDITGKSAASQILLGGVTGWITGFVIVKIGKMAALVIGGSIIILEVASEEGVVMINWTKLSKKVDKVTDKVEEAVTGDKKTWMDKISGISKKNAIFVTAYIGGVFLGIGSG